MGFKPATFRTHGTETTTEPPRPHTILEIVLLSVDLSSTVSLSLSINAWYRRHVTCALYQNSNCLREETQACVLHAGS